MLTLQDRFTPLQVQKLQKERVYSLYDFLTFLPLGVFQVFPMSELHQDHPDGARYLDQATLEKIVHRKTKQKFLQLEWHSSVTGRRYQTYFFSVAKYTLQALQVGQDYQLLLINRNGFWSVDRFAPLATIQNSVQLSLGKSSIKKYLEVYYPKLGSLQSNYFKILHSRLRLEDYQLNLSGLVPESDLIPQTVNLANIHHPRAVADYKQALDQWISLQVFLKLALARFVNKNQEQSLGRAATLDLDFLKNLSKNLPFQLSKSQKQAIWDILQAATTV